MSTRLIGVTTKEILLAGRAEKNDSLDRQWWSTLQDAGLTPVPIPNNPAELSRLLAVFPLQGFLLTGGGDLSAVNPANASPSREAVEKAILDHAVAQKLPVLGVCRGMQFMNLYWKGKLSQVQGHVGAPHPIEWKSEELWGPQVNSYHNYGIQAADIGAELEILATAPDGSVEALKHRKLPQWAVMWHPERGPSTAAEATRLLRHCLGGEK